MFPQCGWSANTEICHKAAPASSSFHWATLPCSSSLHLFKCFSLWRHLPCLFFASSLSPILAALSSLESKASEAGRGPFPFFNDNIVPKHMLKKPPRDGTGALPIGNRPAIGRANTIHDLLLWKVLWYHRAAFKPGWLGTKDLPCWGLPSEGVKRGQDGGCPLLPHKCPLGWDWPRCNAVYPSWEGLRLIR